MPKLGLTAATRIKLVGGELARLKGPGFAWAKPTSGPDYRQITSRGNAVADDFATVLALTALAGDLVLVAGARRTTNVDITFTNSSILRPAMTAAGPTSTGFGRGLGTGAPVDYGALPGSTATQYATLAAAFDMAGGTTLEVSGIVQAGALNSITLDLDAGAAPHALAAVFLTWYTSSSMSAYSVVPAGWNDEVPKAYSSPAPWLGLFTKPLPTGGTTSFTWTKTVGAGNFNAQACGVILRSVA